MLMMTQMIASATVTQNAWLEISVSNSVCSLSDVTSWMVTLPMSALGRPDSSSCMDRSRDQAGDLLGARGGDGFLRHLAAAAQHEDAIGYGEDVGHAVADQHDRDALVAQPADDVEHVGDLAHRDRGGGLVHQHDAGIRQPGACDGDGLALAARHPPDHVARPGLRLQLGEQLCRAVEHLAVFEEAHRTDAPTDLAAEEDVG